MKKTMILNMYNECPAGCANETTDQSQQQKQRKSQTHLNGGSHIDKEDQPLE
jgi:hypothetical protein